MNSDRITYVKNTDFYKAMRKERMIRGFLQHILFTLLLGVAFGLLFWPLSIPFALAIVFFAIREVINIRSSLLALASLSQKDFDDLVRQSIEGRLESAVVGSYTKDGILLRSAYIPYNSIVKMRYHTPDLMNEIVKDIITRLLFGFFTKGKLPCVIIYRKVKIFGKEFVISSEHRLQGNVNHTSALEEFTNRVVANSENKVLIDNDYYFNKI